MRHKVEDSVFIPYSCRSCVDSSNICCDTLGNSASDSCFMKSRSCTTIADSCKSCSIKKNMSTFAVNSCNNCMINGNFSTATINSCNDCRIKNHPSTFASNGYKNCMISSNVSTPSTNSCNYCNIKCNTSTAITNKSLMNRSISSATINSCNKSVINNKHNPVTIKNNGTLNNTNIGSSSNYYICKNNGIHLVAPTRTKNTFDAATTPLFRENVTAKNNTATPTATACNSSDTKLSSWRRLSRESNRQRNIQIDAGHGSTSSHSNNTSDVHVAQDIPLLFSNYNCSWARADGSDRCCRLNIESLLYYTFSACCRGVMKLKPRHFTPKTKSRQSHLMVKSRWFSSSVIYLLLLLIQVNVALTEKGSWKSTEPHHAHVLMNSKTFMDGFRGNQKSNNRVTNWNFEHLFNSRPEHNDQNQVSGAFQTAGTDFHHSTKSRDSSTGHTHKSSDGPKRHRLWRGVPHRAPDGEGAHKEPKAKESGALAPPGKHFAWKSAWQNGRKIPVLSIEPDGQRDRRSLALRLQSYLHHRPRHNRSHGKIAPSSLDQSHGEHLQTSASQDKTVGISAGHHHGSNAKIPSSHHDGGSMKIPRNHSQEGNVGTSDGDVREPNAKPPLRESHSSSKRERLSEMTYSQNPERGRKAIDGYSGGEGGVSPEKNASSGDVDRSKRAWHTHELPQNEDISSQNEEILSQREKNFVQKDYISSVALGSKSRLGHRKKHNQDLKLDHSELTAGLVEEKNILRKEMMKLSNLDEERRMIEKDMEAIEEDIVEILERERRSLQFRREKILRRREKRKMRKEKRRRRRLMRKQERQRNHAIRSEENRAVVSEELAISREFLAAERKKMREERRRQRIARRREKRRERRLRRRLRKRNKFKKNSKETNVVIDIVQFEQDTTNELHGRNACQYKDLLTCARETGLVAHPASARYSLQTAPRCLQRKNFLECMERQRSGASQCSNSTTALGDLKKLRKHLRSAMFSNSSCLIAESIRS